EKSYNAAFHFTPGKTHSERYEKRILVPIGEYLPLSDLPFLSRFFKERFGIFDSFEPGKEAKTFSSFIPIGIALCAEETYGEVIRSTRSKGAELLVSLSN